MSAKTMSHCQGKGSISHNNRDFIFQNVDPDRTKDNITYVKQPLAEAYQECFGEAVREYNEKQARADRKIDDYYAHLFGEQQKNSVATGANKQKSFYETLVQIGTKDDSGVGSADGRLAAKCLDEYMKGFNERNPNFHVFNAVLHMDETTPHLHIDYIPVAAQKKGMTRQNGIAKALEQMGHGKGKDAVNRWRISERKILEEICNRHGIEISEPKKSRGSLSPEEYKTVKDNAKDEARKEFEKDFDAFSSIKQELEDLKKEKADIQAWMQREKTRDAIENKTRHDKLPKIDYSKHRMAHIGNNRIVPVEDYKIMRNRSEWYRKGVGLKEREAAISERETAVSEREQAASDAEKKAKAAQEKADQAQSKADALYSQQLTVNRSLAETRSELSATKEALKNSKATEAKLRGHVAALQQERDAAKNALLRTENALIKGLDSFTFTPKGDTVMVGSDFKAFMDSIKTEKPEHRVLERVHERERELNRLLNRSIGISL